MSYTAAIVLSVSATVLAGVLAIAGFISYKRRQTAKTVQAASLKEVLMPHETIPLNTENSVLIKKGLWPLLDWTEPQS